MGGNTGVVCFTGCYLIAFLLETIRCCTRYSLSRFFTIIATLLGICANILYVGHHFLFQNQHLVTSVGGWFFVLVLILSCSYFYMLLFHSESQYGFFVLPLIFLLIAIAVQVKDLNFSENATGRFIRGFHGISLLMATFCMISGFITGGLYFLQRFRLKNRYCFFSSIHLPSLEGLEKTNRRSVRFSLIFLGLGILSGFYINFIKCFQLGTAYSISMLDPMISGSLILFICMFGFLGIVSFTRFLQGGKCIAALTIGSFLFLLCFLLLGIFYSQKHWQDVQQGDKTVPVSREESR